MTEQPEFFKPKEKEKIPTTRLLPEKSPKAQGSSAFCLNHPKSNFEILAFVKM